MKIEKKKIKDLIPAFYNPRRSTPKQEKNLAESLKKFGVVEPIIWNKQTKNIVGGHFRVRELEKLGFAEVDCVVIDLSLDDEKELNIRLNANTGDWDWPALDEQFDFKQLETWGLEFPELEGQEEKLEAKEDDYEIPEEIKTNIKYGDIYKIGNHRLMCGDSTKIADVERLMDGAIPFMMVTDPPYGVKLDQSWRDGALGDKAMGKGNNNIIQNDDRADWTEVWQNFKGDVAYIWHAGKYTDVVMASLRNASLEPTQQIIWNKSIMVMGRSDYHFKHEPCWYAVRKGASHGWSGDRKQTTVIEAKSPNHIMSGSTEDKTEHPTQKPVECMAYFIRNHKGDVFDPFLGSGSTMVACHQLKRVCYGMELEPKYCQVIIDRMKKLDPDIKISKV